MKEYLNKKKLEILFKRQEWIEGARTKTTI
jgi:hypothetical protein